MTDPITMTDPLTSPTSFDADSTAEDVTAGLDLSGKTILLTGCNSGLGLETMRVLALRGARVIGTARTREKAENACKSLDGDTRGVVCELGDLASVRAAIQQIDEPLDAIIANAGVMAIQQRELIEGVEAHLFTNHVAHFVLVNGLLERLRPNGRVVMLSSGAHAYAKGGNINFDDLGWNHDYTPWAAYGVSKLANILYAKELAKRLPAGQTANALHPGVIYTPLWRHIPAPDADRLKSNLRFKSVPQGAATQVFVATHPSLSGVSGAYFSDCHVAEPTAPALDEALAKHLWQATAQLVASLS